MKDAAPQTIYLADYTPPAFLVESVRLTFFLHPEKTRVLSRIEFSPNPTSDTREFFLHGEDLTLLSAKINGSDVRPTTVQGGIKCDVPYEAFIWEAEVEINPSANTALEGLYMSNG
ncbi:MAG: aminopeptidase N, partial [Pseudomonadota bacterium]